MPHRWNGNLVPGDPRHGTRWATDAERVLATKALADLDVMHNRIVLVPAPEPHFEGHRIRVQEQRNPEWYRSFAAPYWRTPRVFCLKRRRVEKALRRVSIVGIVRRNGYEMALLQSLEERRGITTTARN